MAKSRAIIKQEREFNGGKTNYELRKLAIKQERDRVMSEVAEIMAPVITYVRGKVGEWEYTKVHLDLICGRLPFGDTNGRVCDEWVQYELDKHADPDEEYRQDLQDAYLEMWLASKRIIEEYSEWFYALPRAEKQLAEPADGDFWKAMKPFKITGGYRGF